MTRRIKLTTKNGHKFYRWQDLTNDEKQKVCILTREAISWMVQNPGVVLTYESMNKTGLDHVYRFHIDDYNFTHQWSQIKVLENGLVIEDTYKGL